MIRVRIKHEQWKYRAKPDEQKTLDDFINNILEPILLDCMTYNASVDAIKTLDGNYKLVPKCDQYSTLYKMQELIPEVIPAFTQ